MKSSPVEVPLAGVVGHPVSHSLSPRIFEFISHRLGTPVVYRRIDIPPHGIREFCRFARKVPLFMGWNTTIPHKETVARCVDHLEDAARVLKAVNVVKVSDGKLFGFNTDVYGVCETFREQKAEIRGKSHLLLGAGGAALAVGFALGKLKASQVWVINRTPARAKKLVSLLNSQFPKTQFKVYSGLIEDLPPLFSTYINSTPLGMKGFPQKLALPVRLNRAALAFDLVYRPMNTPFLESLRKQGLKTVGGLDMLIWQAIATWEIWMEHKISNREQLKFGLKKHLSLYLKASI